MRPVLRSLAADAAALITLVIALSAHVQHQVVQVLLTSATTTSPLNPPPRPCHGARSPRWRTFDAGELSGCLGDDAKARRPVTEG